MHSNSLPIVPYCPVLMICWRGFSEMQASKSVRMFMIVTGMDSCLTSHVMPEQALTAQSWRVVRQ